ncbi:protein IWS1 homolog [Liolophura sinensis]|uniref:protein IWS1 homolog n=1 Tax=Liolophura sinensis TaxID=3198878 RepID=UPI00315863D9
MEINTEHTPVSDVGDTASLKDQTNAIDQQQESLPKGVSSDETVVPNGKMAASEVASNQDVQHQNGVEEEEIPSDKRQESDSQVYPVAVMHHLDKEEKQVKTEMRVEVPTKVVASEDREVLQMLKTAEESDNAEAESSSDPSTKHREKIPEADESEGNTKTHVQPEENDENHEQVMENATTESDPSTSGSQLKSPEEQEKASGNNLIVSESETTENDNEVKGESEDKTECGQEAQEDEEVASLETMTEGGAPADENSTETEKEDARTYLINQEAEKQVMHELIDETVVLEKNISELQTKLEQTEAEKSELESKFTSLTDEIHSQKLRITELEAELKEAKMGDGNERKALEESQQKVKDLEEQLKRLAKDDDVKNKKLVEVEKDFIELREKYKSLEQEVKSGEQNQGPKSKTCVIM